jgi:hypothetical protein
LQIVNASNSAPGAAFQASMPESARGMAVFTRGIVGRFIR